MARSRQSNSRSRTRASHSVTRATRAARTLAHFFGLDRRRIARERAAARQARRLARQHRRAERDFANQVTAGRAHGQAAVIRQQSRHALERRERLPDAQIYLLAAIEGAHIDRPGHRRRLAEGLVVRLMMYNGAYYFLSGAGYFYKSPHRYGAGSELDFVVDTWVPLTVRIFAQPYRQLCRR
ncbi:uncharacterized protein GGS22DRAFT_150617 [Annulohypoxylon maeteangense]|uniref:uncharacterized protein n=1 Tax=Annulohypoxylon maeteangense TaxID=1927788 RepID=UPI00200802F6|nr:uncharacterized protein GGS22DRAFT_150617 [Annulohypoxylon maeteangense]KAI0890334.1 hypothetical protein GGS22DRAFT_150617 [Annulohypoxylon maeteangense]